MPQIIVFVHHDSGETGARFLAALEKKVNHTKLKQCTSVDALLTALADTKTILGREVVVLLADTAERLDQLYQEKAVFQDRKTVMVLFSKEAEETSRVHRFFPRYFTYIEDGYDDLCDVLNKMVIQ